MREDNWNNEEEVLAALQVLPPKFLKTRLGVSMKGVRGAPDWLGYESAIWELSEQVRRFLRKHKKLRGKNPILDQVACLAANKKYGKGRQNLVLLLGEYGQDSYGQTLGALLDDDDVYGHAIKALVRANIPGYSEKVSQVLAIEKTSWIKASAKKYLERC